MSANLKGLNGIKGLLLKHGEKAGIAVVGLIALYFVYSSLGLERLDSRYQATNLQQEITQTNATVEQSEWPTPDSDQAEHVRYAKEVAKNADPVVNPEFYEVFGSGFTPVIPPTQRRTDPVLLNAVEVRANGGTGLFAFVDKEILRQQQIAQAAKEAELEKERQRQAEQQLQDDQRRRGRGGRDAEMDTSPFPDHPNRRMVESMSQAAGVPLQGGERIERAYWATVVAKVPVHEQLKLYQDAFQNARGYDAANDFPQYIGYVVERSEVERGKPLQWETVPVYDGQRKSILANAPVDSRGMSTSVMNKLYTSAQEFWAGGGPAPEPVAEHYLGDFVLTFPLPPLVGRDWGTDVTHPDIPLAINAPPLEEEEFEPLAEEPAQPENAPLFQATPDQQTQFQRPGRFGGGQFPGARRGGYGRGFGGERGMAFGGMEAMMGHTGREGGYRGGMTRATGQRTSLPRGVDFWLLRFFDFTVEPGKKYKYRVKLALADPNFGMEDNTLEPAVQDRLRASKSSARVVEEWSEPSPTVGIPLAGMVYVANAKQPSDKKFNDEPTATLMVEMFDVGSDGTAIHVAKEQEFRRGYVVNLYEELEYTGDGDRWIDKFENKYRVQTGTTLLDVTGGDRLNRDMTAPARALLMDPSGQLSIRKELDDSPNVEYLRLLFAEPDRRRGGEHGPTYGGEGTFMPQGRGGRGR